MWSISFWAYKFYRSTKKQVHKRTKCWYIKAQFWTQSRYYWKKAEEDGIKVPKDILNLVAQKVTTNVRDLEAAVTKLKAYIDLDNIEIDIDIVEKIIKEIIIYEKETTNEPSNKINIENIKKILLRELKISK